MTDTAAISIQNLSKKFGAVTALDHLTMTVSTGHVHGFLGPNGAGKSTTIRILLGLIKATSGTVRLLGSDPWSDAATLHRRLAYVPGDVSLWPNLSGGEAIDLLGRARGGIDKKRRSELIDRFDLDPRKKGRTYSKGNRQKVALIAALASNVELLLLDEPTSGLDPLMERVFTDYIRNERETDCTVLLSSHILSEVEALCDHVSIIKKGSIVETGTLEDLQHLHTTEITAAVPHPDKVRLSTIAGVSGLVIENNKIRFDITDETLSEALRALADMGATSLVSKPPTLEELFLRHYETGRTA